MILNILIGVLPMLQNNKHQQTGDHGELLFHQKIVSEYGFEPSDTVHNYPYDFNVKNDRVEVKYSNYTSGAYRANLRGHTPNDFDILVLILNDGNNEHWFIIPMSDVKTKHIKICNIKNHKYSRYLNNWPNQWRV